MKNCLSCQHCEFHHEYDSGVNVVEAKCLKEHRITTEFQSEHYSGVQEHYGAIAQKCSDFELLGSTPTSYERDREFVRLMSISPPPSQRRVNAIAELAKELALARISSGEDFDLHSVEMSFALAETMIDKMIAIGADI